MRPTWKDALATLFVVAIVVPYIGYLSFGEMPFVKDPRGMAGTGLVLGLAAAAVAGRAAFVREPLTEAALGSGVVALVLGIAALVAETNEVLLALFVAAIVVTWAIGEVAHLRQHAGVRRPMVRHT